MYLAFLGVLLLVAKMTAFGPFAAWSWWVVAAPFIGAVLWWHFADTSGWTKRRQMNLMEERKRERRERALVALGLDTARDKRASATRAEVARRAAAGAPNKVNETGEPAQTQHKRVSSDPTL